MLYEVITNRQRHVYGHLITVKVGIEGGTDKRVQLDGLPLDQHDLKGLHTETMQGWCTVERNNFV